MQKTCVVSSNIESVGYDNHKLFIRFHSGGVYSYDDVPYDIYSSLQKVESAGKFFHCFIKGKYHYTRLKEDPFVTH